MAKFTNGTANAAIKGSAGRLFGVVVNSHSSGTIKLNDGADGTASAGVKASGTLTASGVFAAGETVTIGDRTYTFRTALTGVANEVLIGANAAASLDNLKAAINGDAGAGTTYGTGTQAHSNVTATTNTDTTQVVEFWKVGTEGNALVTTETGDNAAWGAGTLASGAEPNYLICNTITFAAGPQTLTFPAPVDFQKGLYLTKGGTIDYTVIYD